jgi:hypothetical protein
MEASQHSLLAACFTLHSVNASLAIVPQRGARLWITLAVETASFPKTVVDFCPSTWHYNPENCAVHNELCTLIMTIILAGVKQCDMLQFHVVS